MSKSLRNTLVLMLIVLAAAAGIAWWFHLPFWLVLGAAALVVVAGAIWSAFA